MTEENPNQELEQEPTTPVIEPTAEVVEPEVKEEPKEEFTKKPNVPVEKQIAKATWEKHEARREAEKERAESERLRKELADIKNIAEPDFETLDPEVYRQQRIKYTEQQQAQYKREVREDIRIEEEATKARIDKSSFQEKYDEDRQRAITEHKDYIGAETSVGNAITRTGRKDIMEILFEGGNATELINYYGSNPAELEKVLSLKSTRASAVMAVQASKLVKAPVKKKDPPGPTTGAGGEIVSGGFETDIHKLSKNQSKYNEIMNKKMNGY